MAKTGQKVVLTQASETREDCTETDRAYGTLKCIWPFRIGWRIQYGFKESACSICTYSLTEVI